MASQGESNGDPWSSASKEKFQNKNLSEYYDPCQEAASRSLRCLHRNGGERSMCHDYFQAYRDCKKEWLAKRKEDRAKMLLK